MRLTNIYKNIITNLETYLLNSIIEPINVTLRNLSPSPYNYSDSSQQRKYDGKYQVQIETMDHSHIIYWSPKYQQYQYVAVRPIYESFGTPIPTDRSITNPEYSILLKNNSKLYQVWNPEQLDKYYDTIFTYNEFDYDRKFENRNSEYLQNFFGDEILDLLIIESKITVTAEKSNEHDSINEYFELYYKETIKTGIPQYTLDDPDTINKGMGSLTQVDSSTYSYNFDTTYIKMHLGEVNIYKSLYKIYNYLTDRDEDSVDIVSVNNEYSFLFALNSDNQYNALPAFFNNGDSITLNPENIEDAETILGTELYNLLMYVNEIALETGSHRSLSATSDGTNVLIDFNYGEYLYQEKILTYLESFALRSVVLSKKYDNINEISEPVIFDSYGNCHIKVDTKQFIFRNSTKRDNSFFKIKERDVVKIFDYRFENNLPTWHEDWIPEYFEINLSDGNGPDAKDVIYSVTDYVSDTTSMISFDLDYKQHTDFIDFVPVYRNMSLYKDFLTQEDSTIHNRLELFNYDLHFINFKVNDKIFNNVIIDDSERFSISGIAIDLDNSKSSAIVELMDSSFSGGKVLSTLRRYSKNDSIRCEEYPLPLLSNEMNNFFNINSINTCNTIQVETQYTSEFVDNMWRTGFDFMTVRNELSAMVDDTSTTIGTYDRTVYNLYNRMFGNFDLAQIRNQKHMYVIFMIKDKYTGKKDFMQVDLMNAPVPIANISSFTNVFNDKEKEMFLHSKEKFQYETNKQHNAFFSNYEEDPYTETVSFKSSLISECNYDTTDVMPVYITDINIKNGNYLNGNIETLYIRNARALSDDMTTIVNLDATIGAMDFIITDRDIAVDLSTIFGTYKVMDYLEIEVVYNKFYKAFDYLDTFSLQFNFNLKNFQVTQQYGINASFVAVGANSINWTRFNIKPPKNIECLPQEVYNESMALEVFDIDDYVWDYVPDDKRCILLNNFVGNNFNNTLDVTEFDSTTFDTSDLAIIDRMKSPYTKYTNQYKKLPFWKSHDSVGKYVRVYVNAYIPNDSTNIFEQFEFYNLYNPSLVESEGTLMMEGKISDYEEGMEFSDMLKMYRNELIWTVYHNVVNTIQTPFKFDITCKIYANKAAYDSNTDATILPEINDFFNITIFNRGDHIKQKHEWYPRILQHMEYFEINPEYDWQSPKDYIYRIEYNLFSDHQDIKVSELFFDVLFMTEDMAVGIPVDYTNVDDQINAVDVEWITNTEEILHYFNWLIRHICPNCTNLHVTLRVKITPTLFGYNIGNFTIGSYTYDVKLEERIPYIYYKESADALMILDKKSEFDVDRIQLSQEIRESMWTDLHGVSPMTGGDPAYTDLNTFCGTVSVPNNTKAQQLIFNSSIYPKKMRFTLQSNSSNKTIHNTEQEFEFPPYDFRVITLEESVITTDFVNGFSGGLANYKVEEISVHLDTTTELPNDILQLAIPAYDESMSRIMSFMDKSAKLVEFKYKKNEEVSIIPQPKKNSEVITNGIQINQFKNDITEQEKYGQLLDIDTHFYINRSYEVILDTKDLENFLPYFELFEPELQLRIPISEPKFLIDAYIEDGKLNKKDHPNWITVTEDTTGINEDFNNYYDLDRHWLYLVGRRTDLNKFTFELTGFVYYQNSDFLEILTKEFYKDGLQKYSMSSKKNFIRPEFVINMLFGAYGIDLINYTIDTFITGAHEEMYDYDTFVSGLITEVGDRYKNVTGQKNAELDIVIEFKSETILDRNFTLNLVGEEKLISWESDHELYMSSFDNSNEVLRGTFSTPHITTDRQMILNDEFKLLRFVFFKKEIPNNKLVSAITTLSEESYESPSDNVNGQGDWTFDEVYDLINNTQVSTLFKAGNRITFNTFILRNNSIAQPKVYNISVDHDGLTDNITSAYMGDVDSVNDIGYIEPRGDKVKLLTAKVPLQLEMSSMEQTKINLKMDNQRLRITNNIYPVYTEFKQQLLESPLKILIHTKKFQIIQDSNYKLLFSIPIEIFKGIEAYISIDKIKVVDNYTSSNDFNVIFGTFNERYTISGSGELQINKILNKFEGGQRIKLEVFNIANTTGAYNTSLLIYYTLNGTQYVESTDIVYDVVLPKVLDNEYLLIDIDRMDYSPPTYSKKVQDIIKQKWVLEEAYVNNTIFPEYYNVYLGTPGCNLSFPDYNWHQSGNVDDSLSQLNDRPTGNGLIANLEDYEDL